MHKITQRGRCDIWAWVHHFHLLSLFYETSNFMQLVSCEIKILLAIEINRVWGQNSSVHISFSLLLFSYLGVSVTQVLFFPFLIQVEMEAHTIGLSTKGSCYLSCWNWVMLVYLIIHVKWMNNKVVQSSAIISTKQYYCWVAELEWKLLCQ